MADAAPIGPSSVFRGERRRSSDAEVSLRPGELPGGPADIGNARQAVALLSLLSRIQILEGVASSERIGRLSALEQLTPIEERLESFRQSAITALDGLNRTRATNLGFFDQDSSTEGFRSARELLSQII